MGRRRAFCRCVNLSDRTLAASREVMLPLAWSEGEDHAVEPAPERADWGLPARGRRSGGAVRRRDRGQVDARHRQAAAGEGPWALFARATSVQAVQTLRRERPPLFLAPLYM